MAGLFFVPKQLARRYPALRDAGLRLDAAFVRGVIALLRRLPFPRARALAMAVMRTLGPLLPMWDKVRRNLEIAFPDLPVARQRALRRGIFAQLGAAFAELALAERLWEQRAERLEFVADPGIRGLQPGGPAMVMVTAHVGAWQLANFVGAHYGVPLTTLYAEESNPALAAIALDLRRTLRCDWLSNQRSIRHIIELLRGGRSVGFASDTRLDQGELLPFFGQAAGTNTIPARLALREGLELVPVRVLRLPDARYRIVLEAPLQPRDASAPQASQVLDMAAQLNARYEAWIRAAPDEWMCLARRWPKDLDKTRKLD